MGAQYVAESFTPAEQERLAHHVSSLDSPVFALRELPQVTRAALFARYSRTPRSLRRLLLDEFLEEADPAAGGGEGTAGQARSRDLFSRVLAEYGDDSVAQLGAVHLACEQASQLLCKAIEWGRLAAYLEQSTRYIPYTDRRDGRYRYHLDPAVDASPHAATYTAAMDGLFDTYSGLLDPLVAHLDGTVPAQDDPGARRRALRALALDLLRGLLPAGTVSNLGVVATPQAFEQMVMRLRASPLPEARDYAELIAAELRKEIPDFLTRLDRPDRGGAWVEYLTEREAAVAEVAADLFAPRTDGGDGDAVRLLEWEQDGEDRIIANAVLPHSDRPLDEIMARLRVIGPMHRAQLFAAAVGERRNRRHRPGRAFEHATYTFEVVSDYGAFRDLQRHRMLTVQWQRLTPSHGYAVPEEVEAAGLGDRWRDAVGRAEAAYEALLPDLPEQAQYLVTLGHRMRYVMRLNAREAMHMIELRTSPQGHPSYRRICLEMHRLIDEQAGHHMVAASMRFIGEQDVHLPRYAAETARS